MARGIREKGETRARLRVPPLPLLQEQGKGSRLPPLLQGKKEPMPLPLILNLTFRDPSAAAEAADKNPQGRRTWMCGVFRGGRMPPRKIPPATRTRCKAPGAKAGCAFFAPGFFAQAQKGGSRRPGAKDFDLD